MGGPTVPNIVLSLLTDNTISLEFSPTKKEITKYYMQIMSKTLPGAKCATHLYLIKRMQSF